MEQLYGAYTSVVEDCIVQLLKQGAKLSELALVRDVDGTEKVVHEPTGIGFRVRKLFLETEFQVVADPLPR